MKSIVRLSLLAAAFLPGTSFSVESTWINPGTGSWFTGANWSTDPAIPTANDYAVISSGTAQVDAPGAQALASHVLHGGNLSVQDGGTLSLLWELYVMRGSSATITGAGTSLTSGYLGVGSDGGGIGELTISGGATVNTIREPLYQAVTARVGGHSTDTYAGGTGTATVTGAGSQWNIDNGLEVGVDPGEGGAVSNGTLNVLDGGKVTVGVHPLSDPEATFINVGWGSHAGTTGQITVSGTDSELEAYAINLGWGAGGGTLTVEDNGVVKAEDISLGTEFGGTGHVNINGAWDGSVYRRGTLETSWIDPHSGSLTFNGGILRATGGNVFASWDEGTTATFSVIGQGALIDTNGEDLEMGMAVSGSGTLVKLGEGELRIGFSEDSTFNGGFTVEQGKLVFDSDVATSFGDLIVRGGEVELQTSHTFSGLGGSDDTSISLNGARSR